jgi:hypothetical protein
MSENGKTGKREPAFARASAVVPRTGLWRDKSARQSRRGRYPEWGVKLAVVRIRKGGYLSLLTSAPTNKMKSFGVPERPRRFAIGLDPACGTKARRGEGDGALGEIALPIPGFRRGFEFDQASPSLWLARRRNRPLGLAWARLRPLRLAWDRLSEILFCFSRKGGRGAPGVSTRGASARAPALREFQRGKTLRRYATVTDRRYTKASPQACSVPHNPA